MKIKKLTVEEILKYKFDGELIYLRKSTDDADNQKNSIEYQMTACLNYAKSKNIRIADITIPGFCKNGIISEHHSGFKEDLDFEMLPDGSIKYEIQRPKFGLLMQLLKLKKVTGCISLCWDRISRNDNDSVLIKKLIKLGSNIRFADTEYAQGSAGTVHMGVDGLFANYYSVTISEKVKKGNAKLIAEGKCIKASPLGYLDASDGTNRKTFDPVRAPIVKEIFEKYSTGEWSYATLADWAQQQGLTTKPRRKNRNEEDRISGLSIAEIPKLSKPVSNKTIEHILVNPFYIGMFIYNGELIKSTSHTPLIDKELFYKVQAIQKQRNKSKNYPEMDFFTFRGFVKCSECQRIYSPYIKKGITYYRSKCRTGCQNTKQNIKQAVIEEYVSQLLEKLIFTNEELCDIEKVAHKEINEISIRRKTEMTEIRRKLDKTLLDLDYLNKEKITLLRLGSTPEEIKKDQERLLAEIESYKKQLNAHVETAEDLVNFVTTFTELIKNTSLYWKYALDTEKNEIMKIIFSELLISSENKNFVANKGFDIVLRRVPYNIENFSALNVSISELLSVKKSLENRLFRIENIFIAN